MRLLVSGLVVALFLWLNPVISPAQSTTGWYEDFESYALGSFPSAHWTYSGNHDIRVDTSVAASGRQSLRLYGVIGGCWAAVTHRPLGVKPPFVLEAYVRTGTEPLYGCHPVRAGYTIHAGPSWTYPQRDLIHFNPDGSLRTSYSRPVIGSYSPLTWVKIRILYERPSPEFVALSYWVNGEFKGRFSEPAIAEEDSLQYIGPNAGEGTSWHDEIRVMPAPSCSTALSLNQQNGDLRLQFQIRTGVPATWNAWLTYRSAALRMWATQLPVIDPVKTFSFRIPYFPYIGNFGVLTTLTNPAGIECSDWRTLDVGIDPTARPITEEELEKQIRESLIGPNP